MEIRLWFEFFCCSCFVSVVTICLFVVVNGWFVVRDDLLMLSWLWLIDLRGLLSLSCLW